MSNVAKTTLGLMVITMISKVLGFLREILLVAIHGANSTADVYITAMNIPGVLFAIIGTALATTFIPLYYEVENKHGQKHALKFANNILNIVIIISVVISLIGFVFSDLLVKIFAINFTGDKLILCVKFTKIIVFSMVFIGINKVLSCWLQIKGNFKIPGMIAYPYNIVLIVSIVLSMNGNLMILPIGAFLAMASQFLLQYPVAKKAGFKYIAYIDFKDRYLKQMIYLLGPVIIGVGVNQINTIVDRSLASTIGDGTIAILNSANRLNAFVLGLFISTITVVIYPMISKLSIDTDKEKFIGIVKQSINIIIILIIPISIGSIVLAEPVVRVVFERGKFDSQSTLLTASALIFYSIGTIGYSLGEILNRIFYSLKDTKTPMIASCISMIINIVLNFIFIGFMGHSGLAFATSISAIICTIVMFISLSKKIGYFGQDEILKTLLKSSISAMIMGVITKIFYDVMSVNLGSGFITDIISLTSSVCIGAVVYGVLIALFKTSEINFFIDYARKKLKI